MSVLLLIAVTIPMSILRTAGNYGVDLMLIYFQIAVIWVVGEWFLRDRWFREWAPAAATFAFLLATYLCIPPNGAVPKFNLDQKLTESAPLDPQRLYLSIYPQPEFEYRIEKKPGPIGQIVRPGSTSMWAGLRFINGYSPIRPAGVAREFYSYIHGEIDLAVGNSLLKEQSGPAGELARLGIDGIVVAKEVDVDPQPASEWELAFSSDEGRVFHRRGPPFLTVRSVTSLDPESGEQFSVATISRIDDSRNRVTVDVDVPSRGKPGLITFSRPYFRGYKARLNDQELSVDSYRGLMPMVKLPPGSRGRVVLSYQPSWLIGGGALSIFSAAICLVAVVYAASARKP